MRFASTVFSYAPTETRRATRTIAEGMGGVFGLSPDALRRHPIALIGTPDEMIAELRRRERTTASRCWRSTSQPEQLRSFGERVLPHVR